MNTRVQMTCTSKKQIKQSNHESAVVQHEIELEVPYDQGSVYFKLSGGTNITLRTINQQAADMFQLQGKYFLDIKPVESEELPATA